MKLTKRNYKLLMELANEKRQLFNAILKKYKITKVHFSYITH
jgi:hypothetical protein